MTRKLNNLSMALMLVMSIVALGCGDGQLEVFASQDLTGGPGGYGGGELEPVDENGNPIPEADLSPAFTLERENIKLLPFHVRFRKLQAVAGVGADDPIFAAVDSNRYDLGDHNYGQGIGADLTWNASKMALWVRSLQPICASDAMRAQYPALPEQLNDLMLASFGREADQADLEAFDAVLADGALSEPDRYQAVCLAVLSSTEFVAQ